ncbi:hypothetical protein DPMN_143808 [Dreissena polymorpha]|uniref:Uncharacterized protein n=1 Tax=Dreissena polymorpha TaxID=45954 RepID=A0A9D4JK06_DREPO|nr:hypothetical protein DPMN_143808 [Dreissena polymorpha]
MKLKNENRILNDALDASEQYRRRNSLRIFGIPESEKSNESTDTIVMNLCKSLGADVSIGEIDRSHRTGKPGGVDPSLLNSSAIVQGKSCIPYDGTSRHTQSTPGSL